jgi:hypothetical protein
LLEWESFGVEVEEIAKELLGHWVTEIDGKVLFDAKPESATHFRQRVCLS